MVKKIEIQLAQSFLDDLIVKLKLTRWPDEIENSGWTYGASLSYMKELADYWINNFNWRNTENEINRHGNFIAQIDGYKIHFLHIKGKGEKSIPLILTHGWPSSFLEMLKLIPLLTENKDFHSIWLSHQCRDMVFHRGLSSPAVMFHLSPIYGIS